MTSAYASRLEAARERAAIMEHDGGLTRAEAEQRAAKVYAVRVEDLRKAGGA